jgi:prophage regulatory protein
MRSNETIVQGGDSPVLIRLPAVKAQTGIARTQIYAGIAAGTFPKPVRLGTRTVAWLQAEINAWIADRIAVRDLEAQG